MIRTSTIDVGTTAGGPARADARRARRARRAATVAIAVVVAAAASLLAPGPASAAPVATTSAVTVGPDPSWTVADVDGLGTVRAAVDAGGWTFLTSKEVLLSTWAPDGSVGHQAGIDGPGAVQGIHENASPDVAAIDDGTHDAVVAGWLTGSVTLGAPQTGAVTLDGGTGSSFLARVSADGHVRWARLFAGGAAKTGLVTFAAGTVVVAGRLLGPATFDSLPPTTAVRNDAFVAAFDPVTGTARWVTEVTVSPRTHPFQDAYIDALEGDDDSVALVSSGSQGLALTGDGQTLSRPCPAGSGWCHIVGDIDLATGRPLLATVASADGDIFIADVEPVDGGYVTLGEDRTLPEPAGPTNAFITRWDAQGAPLWTRYLYNAESLESPADLVVDHNGDIHVGVTFNEQATLGDGPDAPVVTDPSWGVVLAEYGDDGTLTRYVQGFGPFGPTFLGVDAVDTLHVVGQRYSAGTASFGTAPGVGGSGPVVATFQPNVAALATYHPTPPVRVLDSRTSTGGWNQKLTAGSPRTLHVTDTVPGLPYETTAVVLNVTVTDVSEMTYLTAWPTGTTQPVASNLNALAGDTISNQVTVRVGDLQGIQLATAQGSVHVVADLMGYYTATGAGSGYHSLAPTRLLDSRTATGGWPGSLSAAQPRELVVAGANGIPSDAAAVTLSVTATDTSDQTYLRVQPTGSVASHSNIAVDRGETITNLVTTKIGSNGRVTFTNNTGTVHVVADAVGYFDDTGAWFRATPPVRVLDSRFGTGGYSTPWGAGTTRTVPVAQVAPGDEIIAIAANLTATDTTAMSLLTLYPAAPRPGTSNLLFTPGQTIAAAASTGVAPNGTVSLFNQLGSAHLVLDVNGYFVDPATP